MLRHLNFDRTYASPISVPPFTFHDKSLTVDGHSRCPSDDLYTLLTHGHQGPTSSQCLDMPKGFYQAQLIHYGLQPRTTELGAQKALLRAFKSSDGQILEVPRNILILKIQLRKQFRATNRAQRIKHENNWATSLREVQRARLGHRRRSIENLPPALIPTNIQTQWNGQRENNEFTGIEGIYSISAPTITDGYFYDGPLILQLAFSSTRCHIWGNFDFGLYKGKLRSRTPLATLNNDSIIEFQWRGRECGEGVSTFSRENTARFKFLGNGKIVGNIYLGDDIGLCHVTGKIDMERTRNVVLSGSVRAWKLEYRSLNDDNYERERVERWGRRYRGRFQMDEPADSDTD